MNTAMCLTTPPSLWLPLAAMSTSIIKLLLKDGADINSRCVFYVRMHDVRVYFVMGKFVTSIYLVMM